MAGFYPNVPSWRMAYDRDGTQGIRNGTNLTSADMKAINDESDTGISANAGTVTLIFPELRDLDGYFVTNLTDGVYNYRPWSISTSVNTTNGVDGTWTTLISSLASVGAVAPAYRTSIRAITLLAIKAISFNTGAGNDPNMSAIHLYGEISPGQNPNRLVLWHPTLDQRITPAYLDWGNVPRSSSADKTFRVKNLSTVQTANNIRVAQEILTDTIPSVVGQHTLSLDAITFLAQVNIGNLAPGAISTQVLTLRRVTPVDATLSVWAHRVFAEAGTWV